MKKNYRSTQQIREFALPLIKNVPARNLDGEAQGGKHGESIANGEVPTYEFFNDYERMNKRISDLIRAWHREDSNGTDGLGTYAVLIRENGPGFNPQLYLKSQAGGLTQIGLKAEPVDWNMQPRDEDAVKVMSMHRAKGLEFNGVVIVVDRMRSPTQTISPRKSSRSSTTPNCVSCTPS